MEQSRLAHFAKLQHEAAHGTWAQRIIAELGYLLELSRTQDCRLDERLLPQVERLLEIHAREGAIGREDALTVEQALADLGPAAKAYEVTCAAHAHIDMNWMWGFQETAALTVDTFRTMLELMERYPDFTFSQSQASVYHILETYHPAMLEEIRRRVREGRWEVTASSWVENDKNLSGGEAMARHLLYTRQYLSELLDIPQDKIQLDFEPDTFGHCEALPEILRQGGIRYYYHCRGAEGPCLYRWCAPSGAEVLAFEIPWGNSSLRGTIRLDAESPMLRYDLQVDWREFGSPAGIPQLRFDLPLAGPLPVSLCRTPMGLTRRPALAQDVPCLGMLAAETASGHSVALLSDCKYGFRNDGAALGLTLLRSSYDPDRTPEIGTHTMSLAVAVGAAEALLSLERRYALPWISVSNGLQRSSLPPQGQFLQADGCQVSAVKTAEDGCGMILRLYNPTQDHQTASLRFSVPVVSALRQTTLETPLAIPCRWTEHTVLTRLEAFETAAVRVVLSPGESPEAG